MQNRKFLIYLEALQQDEWELLKKKLKVNFGEKSKAYKLFIAIFNNRDLLELKNNSIADFCKQLPIRGFGSQDYHYYVPQLEKELEGFFQERTLAKNKDNLWDLLSRVAIYDRRGLSELYLEEIEKVEKQILAKEVILKEDYYLLHQLFYKAFYLPILAKDNTIAIRYFTKAISYQQAHQLIVELKYFIEWKIYNKISLRETYHGPEYEDLILKCEKPVHSKNRLIQFYIKLIQLELEKIPSEFHRSLIKECEFLALHLGKTEINQISTQIINYTTVRIQNADREELKFILKLYLKWIDKGFLIDDQGLSAITFLNTIEFASSLGYFNIGICFLNKYRELISLESREIVFLVGNATLLFQKGEYRKCMELCQKADSIPKTSSFRLRFYLLDLRCAFFTDSRTWGCKFIWKSFRSI